jgi:betaine-aldehyde dehydrogenase
MRLSSQLEFGTVWINDHLPLASETPHGGFKQSGFGKDLSAEAIGDYQITYSKVYQLSLHCNTL